MLAPRRLLLLVLLAIVGCTPAAVTAFQTVPFVPLCEARGIIQAIINQIDAAGSPSVITVLDAGANVVASVRMDGVPNVADDGAAAKARMTVNLRFPSGAGTNFNFTPPMATAQFPIFEPGQPLFKVDEKLSLWGLGGAFPITRNGTVVGAVGVSGAPTAQGDVAVALAGYLVETCLPALTVNATRYPRLADALARIAAAEAIAPTLQEQHYATVVVDELGRVLAGARTDLAPLISYPLATMKARTLQQLGAVNTTYDLMAQGAFEPFHASFSLDNADGSLQKCPGATLLRNGAAAIVGAVGSSGAMNPVTGDQIVADAAAAAVSTVSPVPTLLLANAYGALQAALNTAFRLGWAVSIAIVDAAGAPKLFFTTPGTVPASLDHAQGKATMGVTVPFPQSVIFPLLYAQANVATDAPTLYNLASQSGGLVAYSGVGTLRDASGNVIGGVGVFSEGNLTVDNLVVEAAVAGAASPLAPSALVLPAFAATMVDPAAPAYAAANVNAAAAHAACWAGFAAGTAAPAACVGRDPRGKVNVVVVQDGVAQGAQRFADRTSHSAFAFPWPSGMFQTAFNPLNGTYFTGSSAEKPLRSVVAPGGLPLLDSTGTLVGTIGFGSSVTATTSLDQGVADAATKAVAAKQAFEAGQFSCQSVVQQYWGALAVQNFTRVAQLVTSDFQLFWPGNPSVLPMAGVFNGAAGIGQFFGIVAQYFSFTFCASTPGPQISAVSATQAYAFWEECSPLVQRPTVVPCPNNLNQALYTCDPVAMKLRRANINLDNQCVAAAIASTATPAPASSAAPADGFIAKLTLGSYAGSVGGALVVGIVLGVVIVVCKGRTAKRFDSRDVALN
jgi:uncharacterized protein GlcG (DUF336 family)